MSSLRWLAGAGLAVSLAAAALAGEAPTSAGTIAPVEATASGAEASSPVMVIDGSGLREDVDRPGVFTHLSNRWADGGCMWTSRGEPVGKAGQCWLRLDLGRSARVTGLHVWNYNEAGGWNRRSIKTFDLFSSEDGERWTELGSFELRCASGSDSEAGEPIQLPKAVTARYLKIVPTAHYGRDNLVGLAEIRVRVADVKPSDRVLSPRPPFKPRYQRTTYAPRPLGQPFPGSENIAWPADAGVVDVTKPPYSAKGDGRTDDTAAINRALAENNDRGAIVFLPNGIYRITDTIKWGRGEKYTTLMGQSEKGTVIKLDDRAPGFGDPRKPKHVIWTGGDPAQRFGNEIAHLTIDTGAGNPGCAGVAFVANNQGAIHHVTIVSGDGQGLQGLHLGAAVENGPLLVRSVTVVGFDVGIAASSCINGQVLEDVSMRDQNIVGIRNHGQALSIRHLTSRNEVEALELKGGLTVLMDSRLEGVGEARRIGAIRPGGGLYARNVEAPGYASALAGGTGARLAEYSSKEAVTLFDSPKRALNLPVKELPPVPWEPPEKWVSPLAYGGRPDDDTDDSDAIQKAIDSGAATVYLPRGLWRIGRPVVVRGKLRRLVGCRGTIDTIGARQRDEPLLRIADGDGPVDIERLNGPWHGTPVLVSETRRTVTVRHCGNVSMSFSGGGEVFLDDVVNNPGARFEFRGVSAWARQFNAEPRGLHVLNDGARLWILGIKTESEGTLIETRSGGSTELLGGLSYTSGGSGGVPMFVVKDAKLSVAIMEVCWDDRYYRTIVRETRRGETRDFKSDDPRWGRNLPLFSGQ